MAEHPQSSQPPPAAPLDSVLLFREVDRLDRRMDELRQNLDRLDSHGSRGLSGLQVQMTELSKDLVSLEQTFSGFRSDLRSSRWALAGAYLGGLLPLYAFVIQQFLK
jgi:hypothetical protein